MTLSSLIASEKLKGVGARSKLPTIDRICNILNLNFDSMNGDNNSNNINDNVKIKESLESKEN